MIIVLHSRDVFTEISHHQNIIVQDPCILHVGKRHRTLHAEISIIPIGTGVTSISREVAVAFDAIRKTDGIKATKLTAMGTQIEADNMNAIFNAIDAAHQAVKSAGVKR